MTTPAAESGGGFWHGVGRQLARPEGPTGHVIGQLMAWANRMPNRLAIEALGPVQGDHVLEIGFGPGLALAELARRVPAARIFGIDASPAMLRQASMRNARALAEGRVSLVIGDFCRLPWADGSFDKVLAVNVAYFFDSAGVAVSEIRRVLVPGGKAVLYVTDRSTMARWRFAGPQTHTVYDANELRSLLVAGGFAGECIEVQTQRLPFGMTGLVAVAARPAG